MTITRRDFLKGLGAALIVVPSTKFIFDLGAVSQRPVQRTPLTRDELLFHLALVRGIDVVAYTLSDGDLAKAVALAASQRQPHDLRKYPTWYLSR